MGIDRQQQTVKQHHNIDIEIYNKIIIYWKK